MSVEFLLGVHLRRSAYYVFLFKVFVTKGWKMIPAVFWDSLMNHV